eukprot:7297563-Prymnesium_polylepis.2
MRTVSRNLPTRGRDLRHRDRPRSRCCDTVSRASHPRATFSFFQSICPPHASPPTTMVSRLAFSSSRWEGGCVLSSRPLTSASAPSLAT